MKELQVVATLGMGGFGRVELVRFHFSVYKPPAIPSETPVFSFSLYFYINIVQDFIIQISVINK